MPEENINAETRFCAVLGWPIRHSASPAMQNAGISALGLNWRYLALEVHPDQLRAAIDGAKAMKFIGLNLTVPHKLLAVPMVDVVDEKAKALGAVNTIVVETRDVNGAWVPLGGVAPEKITEVRSHGFNTDADAVVQAIKEEFKWPDLRGASVLLLGVGGVGRTAALRLAQENVGHLFLVNRTEEKIKEVAAEIAVRYPRVVAHWGYPPGPVDLVINATSLGLKADDALPVDLDWLQSQRPARVFDLIYRPSESAFLREAKSAGCQTANGLGMLLYQGARALELWSGQPAPIKIMRVALEKNVYG